MPPCSSLNSMSWTWKSAVEVLENATLVSELNGESPFKANSFRKVTRLIDGSPEIQAAIEEERFSDVPGVGQGIRTLLHEAKKKGSKAWVQEARSGLPPVLFELLDLPGIGVKKAINLQHNLQIQSMEELEYACRENRLVDLPGFGFKMQASVLDGIRKLRARRGKLLLSDVDSELELFVRQGDLQPRGAWARRDSVIECIEFTTRTSINEELFTKTIDRLAVRSIHRKDPIDPLQESCWFRDVEGNLRRHCLQSSAELKGFFHFHTRLSDGSATLEEMSSAAQTAGFLYAGVSDHSQTAVYARGLTPLQLAEQADQINQWNQHGHGLHLFKGVESDILSDGSLDYPVDTLLKLDFVIASIHSRLGMDSEAMTKRMCAAIHNPFTTILGHWSGRILLGRDASQFDRNQVLDAIEETGVILELNANPARLDVDDEILYSIRNRKINISINPDAHAVEGISDVQYGIDVAQRALFPRSQIVNTWDLAEVTDFLRARRLRAKTSF